MKIENILELETGNEDQIHLVRDRLFWQCWERSAYYFVNHFRKYQIHHRLVAKVGQELVWLGFPRNVLPVLEKESLSRLWSFRVVSEDHILIQGFPAAGDFETWKGAALSALQNAARPADSVIAVPRDADRFLPLYKQSYDFVVYLYGTTSKLSRDVRYGLGERMRLNATEGLESLHLVVNGCEDGIPLLVDYRKRIFRMRLDLRLLKDLHQINIKQWGYLNQQLETIQRILWSESGSSRTAGANPIQSSGTLAMT